MNVAIYCGSAQGNQPIYMETAKQLGKQLGTNGFGIVYGGSKIGLMGAMANEAIATGTNVIGVMPEHLAARELAHKGLTELHLVDSMHVRKKMMVDLADAFIAMPGGCGTLDEYFEVFTWAQIDLHTKPVILFNINGYYDALIMHFDKMFAEGFIKEAHRPILKIASTVEEIFEILK